MAVPLVASYFGSVARTEAGTSRPSHSRLAQVRDGYCRTKVRELPGPARKRATADRGSECAMAESGVVTWSRQIEDYVTVQIPKTVHGGIDDPRTDLIAVRFEDVIVQNVPFVPSNCEHSFATWRAPLRGKDAAAEVASSGAVAARPEGEVTPGLVWSPLPLAHPTAA